MRHPFRETFDARNGAFQSDRTKSKNWRLEQLALFRVIAHFSRFSLRDLLPAYLAIWFVASAVNMWIGVAQAGYTVAEEALVFLPVFCVPALAAILLPRRFGP